jgi:hypothetical protein
MMEPIDGAVGEIVAEVAIVRDRLERRGHLPGPASRVRRRQVFRWLLVGPVLWTPVFLWAGLWELAAFFGLAMLPAVIGLADSEGYLSGYVHGAAKVTKEALDDARLPPEADLAVWLGGPLPPEGQGHLYVIQFHTGVIKVGQTNHAARRLTEHRRDSWAFGVVMTRIWVSPAHEDYLTNEVDLISFTSRSGGRARREYFHGADFDRVVEFARDLVEASAPTTV